MLYTTQVTSHEQGTIADLEQRAASARHATTPQMLPEATIRPKKWDVSFSDPHALAPEEVVYLPAAHGVQLLDDEEEANDQAGHGLQVEAPVAAEYSAGQYVHALAPEEVVYLPAAHGVQLLDDEEEANDPAGHGLQVEAPVATEYLPAGQSVHALAPEEAVYLPAAHRGICASVAAFSAYTL